VLGDERAATGRVWVTRTVAEGTSHKCMDLEKHRNDLFHCPYVFTNQSSDITVPIVTKLRVRRSKNVLRLILAGVKNLSLL